MNGPPEVLLHLGDSSRALLGRGQQLVRAEDTPGVTIGIENADGTSATSIDSQSIGAGNTARATAFTPGQSNCPSGCAPDFNGDGILDPDDLADFISAFFAVPADPRADYDASGSVDPDDLGTYITDFFAGCP